MSGSWAGSGRAGPPQSDAEPSCSHFPRPQYSSEWHRSLTRLCEEAGVERDDDLLSRPNLFGSIPMDFKTLGSVLVMSLGSMAPVIAPAMAPDDFGTIPILDTGQHLGIHSSRSFRVQHHGELVRCVLLRLLSTD